MLNNPVVYKDTFEGFGRIADILPFSERHNAIYGRNDFCRCAINAAIRDKNMATAARAKLDVSLALGKGGGSKQCDRQKGTPSGEWLRKMVSEVTVEEAIKTFDKNTGDVFCRSQKDWSLERR